MSLSIFGKNTLSYMPFLVYHVIDHYIVLITWLRYSLLDFGTIGLCFFPSLVINILGEILGDKAHILFLFKFLPTDLAFTDGSFPSAVALS